MNAADIKNKYADGSNKPYFKFYKKGEFQDEVAYKSEWTQHEPLVREALDRHNGGLGGYKAVGKVRELKDLSEFDSAMTNARAKIVGICYHNGCKEAESGWDALKPQYTNVHFYKVNTLKANDIAEKYADGNAKPYFKFYSKGQL